MSADFWASYLSGAAGIVIGNPLDIAKVQLQVGRISQPAWMPLDTRSHLRNFLRGSAAPILGYGALNSLLFVSYNRTLNFLEPSITDYTRLSHVSLNFVWLAGFVGGLASWLVSAPSELVKCRTQLAADRKTNSLTVFQTVWKTSGLRGLYVGGTVTSIRDAVGYGFYFWSYEICKRQFASSGTSSNPNSSGVLLSGGVAGMVTWTSIYPLDVLKTRIQAPENHPQRKFLAGTLGNDYDPQRERAIIHIAKETVRSEGVRALYKGLGVCNLRAFGVNAVQWFIYEKIMELLVVP